MKNLGNCILIVCIIVGCVIACGCSTQGPSAETEKSVTPAGKVTDAGLRIITEEFPPFNYAGADGKAAGQSTEVVNGILARLNQTAAIEILPWTDGYSLALAGPRVALYSTGRTDERETLFKWVGPIASYEYVLYARNGSGLQINSLETAKKAGLIGVVKESARYQFLLENRFDNISTCGSDAECLRSLMAGTTVLWLGSSENAADIAKKEGIDTSAFEPLYTVRTTPLSIAFSKDTPDSVITSWQEALDAMKRDGTFDAIRKEYGMTTAEATGVTVSAEAQADLALNIIEAETDAQLKAVLRPLEVVAVTTEAESGDWQTISPLLATLEAKEPDARTWYALPDGSYYTVVDGLTSANLKNRSYFPGVLAGKESVGVVVMSYSTGKNVAIIAVPIRNQSSVTGVMGASVYLDTLTDKLRSRVPEPLVFYAIDTESKFALHSDKGQISRNVAIIGPESSFGRAIATIRAQSSGSVTYDDGGIHYTALFRTSPLTGWRLVVAWPQSGSTPAAL
jgi:ABC-type amino acid transport substrate-binding protein